MTSRVEREKGGLHVPPPQAGIRGGATSHPHPSPPLDSSRSEAWQQHCYDYSVTDNTLNVHVRVCTGVGCVHVRVCTGVGCVHVRVCTGVGCLHVRVCTGVGCVHVRVCTGVGCVHVRVCTGVGCVHVHIRVCTDTILMHTYINMYHIHEVLKY